MKKILTFLVVSLSFIFSFQAMSGIIAITKQEVNGIPALVFEMEHGERIEILKVDPDITSFEVIPGENDDIIAEIRFTFAEEGEEEKFSFTKNMDEELEHEIIYALMGLFSIMVRIVEANKVEVDGFQALILKYDFGDRIQILQKNPEIESFYVDHVHAGYDSYDSDDPDDADNAGTQVSIKFKNGREEHIEINFEADIVKIQKLFLHE